MKYLALILMSLSFCAHSQILLQVGISSADCLDYYKKVGFEVEFEPTIVSKHSDLVAENNNYKIRTQFDNSGAISATVKSKSKKAFDSMIEQYELWLLVDQHKFPSETNRSKILSSFQTTLEFPVLFLAINNDSHKKETAEKLNARRCTWTTVLNYQSSGGLSGTEPKKQVFKELKQSEIVMGAEKMPFYKECKSSEDEQRKCTTEKITWFISLFCNYPEIAKEKEITGIVYVSFIVDKTGQVIQPKVLRGIHPLLNEEALKAVALLPKMEPGSTQGKNVNVQHIIPIKFEI